MVSRIAAFAAVLLICGCASNEAPEPFHPDTQRRVLIPGCEELKRDHPEEADC